MNILKSPVTYIAVIVALVVAFFMLNPLFVVTPGERALIMTFGKLESKVYGEGMHFRMPLIQSVVKMNVQTQKLTTNAVAYSNDIQVVESSIALNFHLDESRLIDLYSNVGVSYVSKIIDPAIQESVKSAVAKFKAQELVEQRQQVKEEIRIALKDRLQSWYIITDEFSLSNLDFSDEYERAVEAKQVAQQQALKAKNDLERIRTEAEQRVAQAEAEARAIKIQAESIAKQGGAEYVRLKAIEKWNGQLPSYMMGDNVPFVSVK